MKIFFASVLVLTGAVFALSGCAAKPSVIKVGSKDSAEQIILGEILAQHLEKQMPGVKIERRLGFGPSMVVQGALQDGGIDLYVEDVATALVGVLKEDLPDDETVALTHARDEYERAFQLKILKPLGFHHEFVLLSLANPPAGVKGDTLTDASRSGHAWMLGLAYGLYDRKDAFSVLATQYGLGLRDLPKRMDPPAMYAALKSGAIDMAGGYSIDAWVGQPEFREWKDDRELFKPQAACVVVRDPALAKHAGFETALNQLAGKFTDDSVRKMNQEVDLKHRKPEDVAKAFLAAAGL